jgi:prolyl-tRNA synthetase
MLMPVLQPAELWRKSGRYDIDEVFKLQDRRGAELVLAMTHEENVTFHMSAAVRSYRDLPKILYHFQTKERDEPRPRAGVLRTREFIMKDAYTFDLDREGLDAGYDLHAQAYARIFDRCGLEWYSVESDVGMMGGVGAHEYMAPSPAGENDVALAPGYAANVEVASADPQPVEETTLAVGERLDTPGATTIEAVAAAVGVQAGQTLKAFPVVTESRGLVMVFVRGDHRVNDIKLTNALGETFRPAHDEELRGPAGYLGPVDGVETVWDAAIVPGRYVTGANEAGYHQVITVEPGERLDVRSVVEGDTVGGHPIRIEPAIEIGNIFKLGTRFSEPLGATYLDENGKEQLIWMGSYGIGPARIAAAAVEQFADDAGISWPKSLAPWDVHVVAAGKPGSAEVDAAEQLYGELRAIGLDAIFDDRAVGAGEKFTDAELLGVPLRLTVGKRSLESGSAEAQRRRGAEQLDPIPLDSPAEAVREAWRASP